MIIDFHAHCFPTKIAAKATEFLKKHYVWDTPFDGTLSQLEQSMQEAGVTNAVVHSTATKADQVVSINNYAHSLISDKFYAFGSIHPAFEQIDGEIERIVQLGLKGIKLHTDFQGFDADDPIAFPIYRKASGLLPILFHAGDENLRHAEPIRLANVHKKFPDLTMICAHMGGYKMLDQSREYLIGSDVYIDTSSIMHYISKDEMCELIYSHGVDRCLFGTDFPLTSHKTTLKYFNALGLSDEDSEKILYRNALKLLS